MSGLVELARRYVALSDELKTIRDGIKRAVLNGSGPKENPPPPVRLAGGPHPKAVEAAKAEKAIIALLQASPGLKTSELAKSSGAKKSTVAERLRRLKMRGQVEGGGDEGWRASAPA